MRKVHLITTALGAAVLAIGVAQAGPMGGGMGMAPAAAPPSGPMGVNGMNNQNVSTDTCGDNTATKIPCTHHDPKAKAKAKTKGAASADTRGANASAKTDTGVTAPGAATSGSAAATTSAPTPPSDSPH